MGRAGDPAHGPTGAHLKAGGPANQKGRPKAGGKWTAVTVNATAWSSFIDQLEQGRFDEADVICPQ